MRSRKKLLPDKFWYSHKLFTRKSMDIIGRSYMLITSGSYQVNHSATLPHNAINFFAE